MKSDIGRGSSEQTRFLVSRTAASRLAEAGDDRNLDRTMGVSPPPGARCVCLAEAPDAAVLGAFGNVGVAVAAVLARALVRSVVLLAVR